LTCQPTVSQSSVDAFRSPSIACGPIVMFDPYASEYVNVADRWVVLFGGHDVIVGAGGPPPAAASANPEMAPSTPSRATTIEALFAALKLRKKPVTRSGLGG
jgi:hypothetical protein